MLVENVSGSFPKHSVGERLTRQRNFTLPEQAHSVDAPSLHLGVLLRACGAAEVRTITLSFIDTMVVIEKTERRNMFFAKEHLVPEQPMSRPSPRSFLRNASASLSSWY